MRLDQAVLYLVSEEPNRRFLMSGSDTIVTVILLSDAQLALDLQRHLACIERNGPIRCDSSHDLIVTLLQ
jgi:hypothetical protein